MSDHFDPILDKCLLRLHDCRTPIRTIAKDLNRTEESIQERIEYLTALDMEQDECISL